jgi:hypothetical protein
VVRECKGKPQTERKYLQNAYSIKDFYPEYARSCYVAQDGLELLSSSDSPTSAS